MPELPEVETIRRELAPLVVGRCLVTVQFYWPPVAALPPADAFAREVKGRCVRAVGRRGKYLFLELDGSRYFFVHLRMTGQLHREAYPFSPDPHTRAAIVLDDGYALRFRDQRKFGRFYLVDDPERVVGDLGPEPLDPSWTPQKLANVCRHRRASVKAVLLDQHAVAGLGNIYADEALFVAGIHPCRQAASLTEEEVARLHAAIRHVLTEAIRQGGTTMRSYVRPTGTTGTYQHHRRVYRRAGMPCPRCQTPIQRCRVQGRSTHFCPHCQPL